LRHHYSAIRQVNLPYFLPLRKTLSEHRLKIAGLHANSAPKTAHEIKDYKPILCGRISANLHIDANDFSLSMAFQTYPKIISVPSLYFLLELKKENIRKSDVEVFTMGPPPFHVLSVDECDLPEALLPRYQTGVKV
jgi:hypothetical protein